MWPNVPAYSEPLLQAGSASCPGKIFLWGEYGILAGLPAWVLAVAPRFHAQWGAGPALENRSPFNPHPQSPLGRLLADLERESDAWSARVAEFRKSFRFQDAHGGLGGFGGSTAELILGAHALGVLSESARAGEALWRIYRYLHSADPVLPSGADLLAQVQGGLTRIRLLDPNQVAGRLEFESLPGEAWLSGLMVFSASGIPGRKVATHRHLPELKDRGFFEPGSDLIHTLEPVLSQIASVLSSPASSALKDLGQCVDEFADAIHGLGLEHAATFSDRKRLRSIPGVFGVKGLGALQADAILVLCEADPVVKERVKTEALALGLSPVSLHSEEEPGLQADP